MLAAGQHDSLTVKKLVNMLMNSGVEVHQSKAQFFADGRVFGPGSFVVSMAQPKQALVRWMLGRTFYPDNTYTRDKDNNPIRPCDMATDTFGEFMGVKSDPIGEKPPADLIKLTAHLPLSGTVTANAAGGHLSARLNDSYRAVNLLLGKGATIHRIPSIALGQAPRLRSRQAISSSPGRRTPSSPMWPGKPASISRLRRRGALSNPQAAHRDVSALQRRQYGRRLDAADVRQFNVPFATIRDADIKAGNLNAKFDVVVLPNDAIAAMTGERPAGGNQPPPEDLTPPEYRSGFGAEGVKCSRRLSRAEARSSHSGKQATFPFSASACRYATS